MIPVRAPKAIGLVILRVLLLLSCIGFVASTRQVRDGYARLQSLELQRWQLQEQYTRLLLEMNTWAAPHRVGQIASDTLSMNAPDLSVSHSVKEP